MVGDQGDMNGHFQYYNDVLNHSLDRLMLFDARNAFRQGLLKALCALVSAHGLVKISLHNLIRTAIKMNKRRIDACVIRTHAPEGIALAGQRVNHSAKAP